MRIAVFVEFFPPRLGSDRRIYEIMRRLADKHEVHFLVIPPLRLFYGVVSLKGSLRRHLWKRESSLLSNKITGHFIPISWRIYNLWRGRLGALAYILTSFSLFFKVIKALRRVNPDVIVLNFPSANTGILGLMAGKILRKKVLLDFCDLIAQYSASLLRLKRVKAKLLLLIQNVTVRNSDRIVAATEFIRKYAIYVKEHPESILTIPNGADTRLFNPDSYDYKETKAGLDLPLDGKLCVYCGRFDQWAGREILEKVAKRLEEEETGVKILAFGEGWDGNASTNNVLVGAIPHGKVPFILSFADVVLVPFPDEDFTHAASPLKLFEAMAMARPVVASRISGVQEVIKNDENGILADPNDINDWCDSILFLIRHPLISKKIGWNARRTVEVGHDWNVLSKRYEEVLLELPQKHI